MKLTGSEELAYQRARNLGVHISRAQMQEILRLAHEDALIRALTEITAQPVSKGGAHDLRYFGAPAWMPGLLVAPVGIIADCRPCKWRTHLEGGHGTTAFLRLEAMHDGLPDPFFR